MNTMNKSPHKTEYRVGIGASSILMIFIILCLTTLGVLSFASSRADLSLTSRRVAQSEAYYRGIADSQALIADVDSALYAARQAAGDDEEAYIASLAAIADISEFISVKESVITLKVPVGDKQRLQIDMTVGGLDDAARYAVTKHYLVNVETWEPDTSITLFH